MSSGDGTSSDQEPGWERLSSLPDPAVEARIAGLLHDWCGRTVNLCPCDPRPLPKPVSSPQVRRLQRAARAEQELAGELAPLVDWGAA